MNRRTRAVAVAVATALATASATVVLAASSASPPGPRAVPGVSVTRFVVRDTAGHVVARGATATLPGHPAETDPTTTATGTRVSTATRRSGHSVRQRPAPPVRERAQVATLR